MNVWNRYLPRYLRCVYIPPLRSNTSSIYAGVIYAFSEVLMDLFSLSVRIACV